MQALDLVDKSAISDLSFDEMDLVGGGKESITNMITGVGGMGAGAATIGGGLEMAGLAGALVVGGGTVVAAAGVGLAGYGLYEYLRND